MSEYRRLLPSSSHEEQQQHVNEFYKLVEGMVWRNTPTDPIESAMLQAVLPEICIGGRLLPAVGNALEIRRATEKYSPTPYVLRLMEFAIDKQLRREAEDIYPQYADNYSTWLEHDLLGRLDYDEVLIDTLDSLRTCIPQGYQVFHLMSYAYKDRLTQNPVLLDSGTSLGLGPLKWLEEPFRPISVVKKPRPGEPIVPGELEPDEEAQALVNYLCGQPPLISKAYGIDILPISPEDMASRALGFSHSFPFSESYKNPVAVEEFNRLSELKSKKFKVVRHNIDVTDSSSLAEGLITELQGRKIGLFTASAALFQMDPRLVPRAFDNLKAYGMDSSPFFINEFAKLNRKAPNGIKVIRQDWWHRDAAFATFIIDPLRTAKQPVEVCRYLTRRCEEMWLTDYGRALLDKAAADA